MTFKIKTGCYLELLTPEPMKLIRSTASKIGENVSYLETAEVVIIHCNVFNNSYQQNSRVLYTFVPNKLFSQLSIFYPKMLYF